MTLYPRKKTRLSPICLVGGNLARFGHMTYYVRATNGKRYGPVDLDTLNRWAAEGRIGPATIIEDEEHDQVLAFALRGLTLTTYAGAIPDARPKLDWAVAGSASQIVAAAPGYEPLFKPGPAETHVVKNVLHLVLGFLPITLVALFYSHQTNQRNTAGDYELAARHSEQAKFWGDVSFLAALALFLLFVGVPALNALREWR